MVDLDWSVMVACCHHAAERLLENPSVKVTQPVASRAIHTNGQPSANSWHLVTKLAAMRALTKEGVVHQQVHIGLEVM